MATDWRTICELMTAAIDFADAAEAAGFYEEDRGLIVQTGGHSVSLYDLMAGAHTLPEALRYDISRQRHDKGADAPYISEFSPIITSMGEACAELAGAGDAQPADTQIRAAISW